MRPWLIICLCASVFAALRTARSEWHSQAAAAASTRWALFLPLCLHLTRLFTVIRTETFCPLSSHCCVLFCHGWLKRNVMHMAAEEIERGTKVIYAIFLFLFFFFKWEPKKGDGNCLMILHTSMWINPAPRLHPMEMFTEMLLTWVSASPSLSMLCWEY